MSELPSRHESDTSVYDALHDAATSLELAATAYAPGGVIEQVIEQGRAQLIDCGAYILELTNRATAAADLVEHVQQELDESSEAEFEHAGNEALAARHKETIYKLVTRLRDARRLHRQLGALMEQADRHCEKLRATIAECEAKQQMIPTVADLAGQLRDALATATVLPSLPQADFEPSIDQIPERPIVPAPRHNTFIEIANQAMRSIEPGASIFHTTDQTTAPASDQTEALPVYRIPQLRISTLDKLVN